MAFLEALEESYETVSRWVFGPTPRERAREAQSHVRRAQRDLERERWTLQQRRAKCVAELRERAKTAHSLDDLRSVASEISRIRGALRNVERMNRLLDGVSAKVLSASTSVAVTGVLQSVTETLAGIHGSESVSSVSHILRDFERETMRQDAHDDALQDLTTFDNEEEDTEDIVAQICDESNIRLAFDLPGARGETALPDAPVAPPAPPSRRGPGDGHSGGAPPPPPPGNPESSVATEEALNVDLLRRLEALRTA